VLSTEINTEAGLGNVVTAIAASLIPPAMLVLPVRGAAQLPALAALPRTSRCPSALLLPGDGLLLGALRWRLILGLLRPLHFMLRLLLRPLLLRLLLLLPLLLRLSLLLLALVLLPLLLLPLLLLALRLLGALLLLRRLRGLLRGLLLRLAMPLLRLLPALRVSLLLTPALRLGWPFLVILVLQRVGRSHCSKKQYKRGGGDASINFHNWLVR